MKLQKIITAQFIVLLIGLLFAWTNFTWELVYWFKALACPFGCSLFGRPVNPFLTPCFYGALFFTASFILSAIIFRHRQHFSA
jgi:hypothetical protein